MSTRKAEGGEEVETNPDEINVCQVRSNQILKIEYVLFQSWNSTFYSFIQATVRKFSFFILIKVLNILLFLSNLQVRFTKIQFLE